MQEIIAFQNSRLGLFLNGRPQFLTEALHICQVGSQLCFSFIAAMKLQIYLLLPNGKALHLLLLKQRNDLRVGNIARIQIKQTQNPG